MIRDMTSGKPLRSMIFFVIPVLLGNLFQQFYSLADTLIVGRALGEASLGAVGATANLTSFIIYFVSGLTSGLSVVLGQRFGAKDEVGVRRSAAAGTMLGIGFAVVLTALAVSLSRPVLEFMQTPPDIIGEAQDYMVIIFWGTGATVAYNLISNMLRALGDSRTPLIFLVISSALNILLDLLFVLATGLGVRGAALATVISQLVSGAMCILYAKKRFPQLHFSREDCRAAVSVLGAHLRVALPMGLQMSVMTVGLIAMSAAVNRFGSTVVSAFTVASRVSAFAEIPQLSMQATVSAYVAQNYGAKKFRRIRTGTKQMLLVSIGAALLMTALMQLLNRPLVGFFIENPTADVIDYATRFIRVVSPFYFLLAILMLCRASVQSMGNSVVPFTACIIELVLRVGCSVWAINNMNYFGVCIATPFSWLGAAVFLFTSFMVVLNRRSKETAAEAKTN